MGLLNKREMRGRECDGVRFVQGASEQQDRTGEMGGAQTVRAQRANWRQVLGDI